MAYQNVGTPRFYINVLEWLDSVGHSTGLNNIYRTLPVNPTIIEAGEVTPPQGSGVMSDPTRRFLAVLGHNYKTENVTFGVQNILNQYFYIDPIINANGNTSMTCSYDGFSICEIENEINDDFVFNISGIASVGSIIIGTFYDMPHSPDLNLTMTREYGGAKEFTTHNGSSMSNTMWHSAPKWGDLGAWELSSNGTTNHTLAKSGRRTWDLKFSYMDDGDLWGSNQMLTTRIGYTLSQSQMDLYDDDDLHDNSNFKYSIQEDDNFFSRVWHKTLGGTLPFIFQPDSSNNNPDQFAICKFKDNSLKATQSAFNVYDISLSIEEVW